MNAATKLIAAARQLAKDVEATYANLHAFNRWVEEDGLLDTLDELGIGSIVLPPVSTFSVSKRLACVSTWLRLGSLVVISPFNWARAASRSRESSAWVADLDFTGAFGARDLKANYLLAVEERKCTAFRNGVFQRRHVVQAKTLPAGQRQFHRG